jgi:hypothetical protein
VFFINTSLESRRKSWVEHGRLRMCMGFLWKYGRKAKTRGIYLRDNINWMLQI